MPITFVIGRAGSGKTRRCFDRIVAAMRAEALGPPIYWIVPRQATFTAERELTCNSGLGAFTRARVVSFEQLADDVLAACGGNAVPEVSALGRQMILGHLLRDLQPRLQFFKSVARQPGVAAELDATFAELERAGKGSADLAALLDERAPFADTEADPDALVPKLRDLKLLYDEYTAFLGQDRFDQHRRLTRVLECVKQARAFRGASVYIDGFYDFTDHERRLIAALGDVASSVEVTLTIDPRSPIVHDPHQLPDDLSLFHRSEEAYRRLWFVLSEAGVRINDPVFLRDHPRFTSNALRHVERHLFATTPSITDDAVGIELLIAVDRAAEVDAAARRVRGLATAGTRLRDIAVLVRDVDAYEPLIAQSFREHGLPCFIDKRRTAAHHPLLMFVRAAIRIARFDWPHDAVMSLLKTGLAGTTPEAVDELENYVLDHRLRGGTAWLSPEPWAYRGDLARRRDDDETDGEDAAALDASARVEAVRRQLIERLRPLTEAFGNKDGVSALRDRAAAVFGVIHSCGVRKTLAQWMAQASAGGDGEQHDEHQQVWAELVGLFDQMVELLGDSAVTPGDFNDVLESGLERFDLALTPPTVDQVLVGQIDRTRTQMGLKVAVFMGLAEGDFPRAAHDACILTDAERKALRRRKLDLDPDPRRRLLDERFLGYVAFTRASERLILCRPISPDGTEPVSASPFWREVEGMFPSLATTEVPPGHANDVRQVATPRQLVIALAKWVRVGGGVVSHPLPHSGGGLERGSGENEDPGSPPARPSPGVPAEGVEGNATFASLYNWLTRRPSDGSPLDIARRHIWPALSYVNDACLSKDVARRLFPAPLQATASRLETFAACPFRHFMRYGLRLRERQSQAVTSVDLSQVFHHVMQRLVADALAAGKEWAGVESPVCEEAIQACTREIGEALRNELMISSARNRYLLTRVERAVAQVIEAQCEAMRRGQFRPQRSGLAYDGNGGLTPLRVKTRSGAEVVVRGKIDRVDHVGQHVAVMDYRLGSNRLSLQEVYHGLSLQLLTGLLALQDSGRTPGGKPALPAAAFYLQMLRHLNDVKHPEEAADPSGPAFRLRVKPRGIFDAGVLPALDSDLIDGSSDVVSVHIKKSGDFGNRGSTDVAEPEEFAALLAHVRTRIADLADRILAGDVAIMPFKLGTSSPCSRCEFKGVCRFEPSVNRYRHLAPLGREEALRKMTEGAAADA